MSNENDVGVVCCYFNPCHYKTKLINYKKFYNSIEGSKIDLLTVELAIGDDDFEISDIPNVIKVRSKSILWHKERLLNIGIKELIEKGYKKICWLDADVKFEEKEWLKNISDELENHMVCRVFTDAIKEGQQTPPTAGLGWAARSELFEKIELYDKGIIGGGDTLNAFAFGGDILDAFTFHISLEEHLKKILSEEMLIHHNKWVKKCSNIVNGDVGFAKNNISSFYHGHINDRSFKYRPTILTYFKFNPEQDIKLNEYDCYEWATEKPNMHRRVKEYFINRREDISQEKYFINRKKETAQNFYKSQNFYLQCKTCNHKIQNFKEWFDNNQKCSCGSVIVDVKS